MSLRARIFIIVSIVVLLVLAVSVFLIVKNKNKSTDSTPTPNISTGLPSQNGGTQTTDVQALVEQGLPAKKPTPLEVEQNAVGQFAKVFVERYGTYSTDNEFQNIKESQPLVTASLWSRISAGINAKNTDSNFLGLTTKVMGVRLVNWEDTKATVELKTMRTEDKNGAISTRYQNVTVGMVKENGVWLANTLVWN